MSFAFFVHVTLCLMSFVQDLSPLYFSLSTCLLCRAARGYDGMMETPIATQQAAWPSLVVVVGCGDLINFQERAGCGFLAKVVILHNIQHHTRHYTVSNGETMVRACCVCVQGIEIMLGYPPSASGELQPRISSSVGAPSAP